MENLTDAIAALLPDELRAELRDNIDALVRARFEKMDLLTREQFETREKVLQRTRQRVQELEKQVTELEARLNIANDNAASDTKLNDTKGKK